MAFSTWTDPSIFAETQNVNSVVLNKYLSENMRYLLKRPRALSTLINIGSYSTTSTSFVAVDTTTLRLAVTTQQQTDLRFWLNAGFTVNSTSPRNVSFDVLMDGATYMSTNTATAATNGIKQVTNNSLNGVPKSANFEFVWEDVAAGSHYFDLYWKVSTNTVFLLTNPTLQFGLIEV